MSDKCFCCGRDNPQFVWRRGIVVVLCGKCFFEALSAWMDYAGKEELTNHITFRDLLVVLKAYVDYNSAFAAGAHLGLDQSVVYDRLARLEVLKGHVLMRDHNQHRIPVLNEHGESLLRGYAGLLLVGVK